MSGNQEAMLSAVRVRGTTSLTGGNDPLVIIDGVQSDIMSLFTIYPADIESFTILKDASETAQYGSRGAAGVIEVATKKGKAEKFHIAYSGTIGFESIYKNIEMLNASDFRSAAKAMGKDITDMGYDTDFTKVPTRTGYVHNHHIAFGGGSEIANYRVSMGVQDHRTVIKHNRYRNYSAKIDVTQMAFENRLTVDLGVFGSLQKDDYVPFPQKLFYSAATFNPTFADGKNASGGYDNVPEAQWIKQSQRSHGRAGRCEQCPCQCASARYGEFRLRSDIAGLWLFLVQQHS
jgi:TonB-dependent SusC/RagA subfamily outer membrane receptor